MNGIEKLVKSMLGIDPEVIKKQAKDLYDHYQNKVINDEDRFIALEARIRELEEHCGIAKEELVPAELLEHDKEPE